MPTSEHKDPRHGPGLSPAAAPQTVRPSNPGRPASAPREIGGPEGPEPTRFGDWEHNGRCIDF
ncbi:MAG: DUF1674 domain-containing protein [Proteobacteria bacterium]|nr:DUF1674 domain-containing protein [Pseudomonadota bacterium]